jgi:hypothetical protein
MKDTPKPEDLSKDPSRCNHALLMNRDDETAVVHWDCIYCGSVAFFDPGKQGMLIPRPS